jgi:hypothetical protein
MLNRLLKRIILLFGVSIEKDFYVARVLTIILSSLFVSVIKLQLHYVRLRQRAHVLVYDAAVVSATDFCHILETYFVFRNLPKEGAFKRSTATSTCCNAYGLPALRGVIEQRRRRQQGPEFYDTSFIHMSKKLLACISRYGICGLVGRAKPSSGVTWVQSLPAAPSIEVWQWTFGSRTVWLFNKSAAL